MSPGRPSAWCQIRKVAVRGVRRDGMEQIKAQEKKHTIGEDVAKIRTHPLIPDSVTVGGFIYDVDTGILNPVS